jgi:hypothetical protein
MPLGKYESMHLPVSYLLICLAIILDGAFSLRQAAKVASISVSYVQPNRFINDSRFQPYPPHSDTISSAMSSSIDIKPCPTSTTPPGTPHNRQQPPTETKPTLKTPSTPKKRSSGSSASPDQITTTPASSPTKKRGRPAQVKTESPGSGGGRKTGSWTKSEIRALWDSVMTPPVSQ